MTKLFVKITLLSISLFFILSIVVFAQEQEVVPSQTIEAVNLDENIRAQDLGVAEPRILFDSPFYFLKNIKRGIQSVFTFNPIAKAELRLKFANEKLIEVKKLAETKPGGLAKALENYKVETDKLKAMVDKIKETTDNPRVDKFLDKFVDNTLKQQKLLGKFEKELPAEAYEIVETIKDENMAKFSDISLKLASPEVLQEKITKTIETQPGSDFKQFKNLEVLQQVAERVPATAQAAIQQATENSLNRLKGDLEKMSPEDRGRFKNYVENIGGNETRHLEIIDELGREEMSQTVREEVGRAQEKILERVEARLKEYEEKQMVEAQKTYLAPLAGYGRIEDLRAVKEMENNLSPQVALPVLDLKQRVTKNVVEALNKVETMEQQKELFQKVEKFHDAQQLEAIREIKELIPPEKQELHQKLEEVTTAKMKEEAERAEKGTPEEKSMILETLAGDSPEHINVLQEAEAPREVTEKTVEMIAARVEAITDPAKLETLKTKLEEKDIKATIEKTNSAFLKTLEERSEANGKFTTLEMAKRQIQQAQENLVSIRNLSNSIAPEVQPELQKSNFGALMEAAKANLEKAETALKENNFGEAFGRANASSQNSANAQDVLLKTITQQESLGTRNEKWRNFLQEVQKKMPDALPYSIETSNGSLTFSVSILLACPIPSIPSVESCRGNWRVNTDPKGCPYFECVGTVTNLSCAPADVKINRDPRVGLINQQCCSGLKEIKISEYYSICQKETVGQECQSNSDCPQALCPEKISKCYEGRCIVPLCAQSTPLPVKPTAPPVCIQVITPAIGPNNVCKEFGTPCEVPDGWKRVDKCPSSYTPPECYYGQERYYDCPQNERAPWCKCTQEGKWDCVADPQAKCPVVEIRYYTCPDGTKVESGRCYAGGSCMMSMSLERQCPQLATPVIRGTECPILREMKYFQCSDGSQIPWCYCLPEGGFVGAKNKWQCQYYSVGFTCLKPIVAPVPVSPEVAACCFKDGMCKLENKEECIAKGAKVSGSSCSPNPCPQPAPTISTPSYYINCKGGGIKDHRCSDGTMISWQCNCLNVKPDATAYSLWNCTLEPTKSCHDPIDSAQLALVRMEIRHYFSSMQFFWETNKPTISYMEYGPTTSYGSKAGGLTSAGGSLDTPGTLFVVEGQHLLIGTGDNAKLRPYTTYHFRIIATDTNGNKLVSDDYTFSTVPECLTGTVRNYQCSNGTLVDWCQCTAEQKWSCSSSPEIACPVIQQPIAVECKSGEIKQYKCSDGTLVSHCKCLPEGKWDCIVSPEKSCPVATTDTTTPVVDTTAPIISDITARDITFSAAKIEWKTDEPATSQVVWGTTDIYHTGSEIQTQPVLSFVSYHSVPLSDLQPNTVYHFRVESKDAAGNSAISESKFFTTSEKPIGFIKNQLANITGIFFRLLEGFKNLLGR